MGKKHYSGKELILRRQIERQQAEKEANTGNRLTKTLQQANAIRPIVERAKQRIKEGKRYADGNI